MKFKIRDFKNMSLVLVSNYLTIFTQNFSDSSGNSNKDYTNLINVN